MAEIDTLKDGLERLVKTTQQILHLVNKNRTACERPPAHGYDEMFSDAMAQLEDIELLLEGKSSTRKR